MNRNFVLHKLYERTEAAGEILLRHVHQIAGRDKEGLKVSARHSVAVFHHAQLMLPFNAADTNTGGKQLKEALIKQCLEEIRQRYKLDDHLSDHPSARCRPVQAVGMVCFS